MRKFNSKEELIEAKAQAQHAANLESGGVFDENGERYSDIETERHWAAIRVARAPGGGHNQFYAVPEEIPCHYIPGFGYAPLAPEKETADAEF